MPIVGRSIQLASTVATVLLCYPERFGVDGVGRLVLLRGTPTHAERLPPGYRRLS